MANSSTMRRPLRVLLTAAITIAASAVIGLPSAVADSRSCTSDGKSGCATFRSIGTYFIVCDDAKDGYSVLARYTYKDLRFGRLITKTAVNYGGVDRINYGGIAPGCKPIRSGLPVQELTYQVCLADNAVPGGRPMVILESTCGPDQKDVKH